MEEATSSAATKRRRAGRPKVTDSDDFKAAVDRAVEDRVKAIETRLFEQLAAANAGGGNASGVLGEIMDRLSVNLQAVAQQGERTKPLSAEELRKREEAHSKMEALIAASRLPGAEKPEYKVISKIYFQERFIEPFRQDPVTKAMVHNVVGWTGAPNDALMPLNDVAKAIFQAWLGYTGGKSALVPTADTRPLYMTAAGLTVRGEPPKRRTMGAEQEMAGDDLSLRNDVNAPTIAVLGTVAPRATQNTLAGVT